MFARFSPQRRTPNDYVNELCIYLRSIHTKIHSQLEAELGGDGEQQLDGG